MSHEPRGWRSSAAVQEGAANWRHGRWTTAALIVFITVTVSLGSIADTNNVIALASDQDEWLASGGTILIATNDEAGGVSAAKCERLNASPDIIAAVALTRWPEPVALTTAPDSPLVLVAATAGVGEFLGSSGPPTGPIIPPSLAASAGLGNGSYFRLRQISSQRGDQPPTIDAHDDPVPAHSLRVATISDLAIFGETMSAGIVVPASAIGLADSCFVAGNVDGLDALRESLAALVTPAAAESPTIVADRLVHGKFARDYHRDDETRALRWIPWVGGAAMGAFWLVIRWLRRSGDGLYATLGATAGVRTTIRMTEWACSVALATGVALLISGACCLAVGGPPALVWTHVTRFSIVFVCTSTAVALLWSLVPMRNPLAALKDR